MSYDLAAALRTPAVEEIDKSLVRAVVSQPPFIQVPGAFNFRELGVKPPDNNNAGHVTAKEALPGVKAGYIFRCGTLDGLSEEGKRVIIGLGVRKIFDLRSSGETEKYPTPRIEGVATEWTDSIHASRAADSVDEKNGADAKDSPVEAREKSGDLLAEMYFAMLKTHAALWRGVFAHIRDCPGEPFLFHCTAGKDRTGLLAALILRVAGISVELINREYALTRLGIDEARPKLLERLGVKTVGELSGNYRAYSEVPVDGITPVFDYLDEMYGGVGGYLEQELGFNQDEISTIRGNLAGEKS